MSEEPQSSAIEIAVMKNSIERIENTLAAISETLSQLVGLEAKHLETREAIARAFQQMETDKKEHRSWLDDHEIRIRTCETTAVESHIANRWVLGGAAGIIALLLTTCGILTFHIITSSK